MYTMDAIEMVDTSSNFFILSAYVGSKFRTAKDTAPNVRMNKWKRKQKTSSFPATLTFFVIMLTEFSSLSSSMDLGRRVVIWKITEVRQWVSFGPSLHCLNSLSTQNLARKRTEEATKRGAVVTGEGEVDGVVAENARKQTHAIAITEQRNLPTREILRILQMFASFL